MRPAQPPPPMAIPPPMSPPPVFTLPKVECPRGMSFLCRNIGDLIADAWILTERGEPETTIFNLNDGFDLYIDCARFLPYNVTITKVSVSLSSISFILKPLFQ